MLSGIIQFDNLVTRFISGLIPHNRLLDFVFSFFSLKGMSIGIWIIFVVALLILEETHLKKGRRKFLTVFFISLAVTALLVTGLKRISHRPRPCSTDFNRFQPSQTWFQPSQTWFRPISTDYNCPKDFSFPSGHASVAFASSAVLAFFDKKKKWFYYGMAVLISLSRVYLGVHYFFDVFAGGIIGYVTSVILMKFI